MQVSTEGRHVSWLLADDLRGCILDDAGAVDPRACLGSNEVLSGLANAPNTGIAFTRCAKELNDLGRQYRRVQQEPAFIQDRDASSARSPRCALRRRMRDEQ